MLGKLVINKKEYPLDVLDGNDVYKGLKGVQKFDKICLLKFNIISYVCISTTDMKFNIDIIFLQNNIVVSVHENVSPKEQPIFDFADAVIETNINFIKSNNIKIGDRLEII